MNEKQDAEKSFKGIRVTDKFIFWNQKYVTQRKSDQMP
jgi:hypothetical protein